MSHPLNRRWIRLLWEVEDCCQNSLVESVSGSGPSTFALCNNSIITENISKKARQMYVDAGYECNIYVSEINNEGVKLY